MPRRASAAAAFAAAPSQKLVPLLNREPSALLVAEIKFRHGSGFGCLLIRRLNGPEVLPALSDDQHAPASARFLAALHENDVRAPKEETLCRNMIRPATMPLSSSSSTS